MFGFVLLDLLDFLGSLVSFLFLKNLLAKELWFNS
jgi:hypothetical protein